MSIVDDQENQSDEYVRRAKEIGQIFARKLMSIETRGLHVAERIRDILRHLEDGELATALEMLTSEDPSNTHMRVKIAINDLLTEYRSLREWFRRYENIDASVSVTFLSELKAL